MAEKAASKGSGDSTGAPPETEPDQTEEKAPRGRGSGEYVVIADQLPLKDGTGKDASFQVHRRGARVTLTGAQASMLGGGTRPAVVPASEVSQAKGGVDGAAVRALRQAAESRTKRRKNR